jgi:hypothetical protein
VTKKQKLLLAILANQRDVRFSDACKAAELLGFTFRGIRGSHTTFSKPGEPWQPNFQNRNGTIPTYQAKQLANYIREHPEYLDQPDE